MNQNYWHFIDVLDYRDSYAREQNKKIELE